MNSAYYEVNADLSWDEVLEDRVESLEDYLDRTLSLTEVFRVSERLIDQDR